jgi:putative transposase
MDRFLGKYRISSTRLQTWDYSWDGYYFITICTQDREKYFGKISDGKMMLNDWGEIAKKYWMEIPAHFENTKIDEFVVMPNHIHGIIVLGKDDVDVRENVGNVGNVGNVETRHCLVSTKTNTHSNKITKTETDIGKNRFQNQGSKTVSSIIGSYKSICTKTINRMQKSFVFSWQKGFYDHIIRDKESLGNIRNYIINNPAKWVEVENDI